MDGLPELRNRTPLENEIGKQAANLEQQPVRKAALGDKTIGPVAAAFFFQRRPVDLRVDDHAQAGKGTAKLPGSLQAVKPRHAEIQQREIGPMMRCELNGVEAVTSGTNHFEAPGETQVVADGPKGGRGIVRDQNTNGRSRGHAYSRDGIVTAM